MHNIEARKLFENVILGYACKLHEYGSYRTLSDDIFMQDVYKSVSCTVSIPSPRPMLLLDGTWLATQYKSSIGCKPGRGRLARGLERTKIRTLIMIDWLIDWLIDRSIEWLMDGWIDWLIDWLIDWSIDCMIDRLNDWLMDGWIPNIWRNDMPGRNNTLPDIVRHWSASVTSLLLVVVHLPSFCNQSIITFNTSFTLTPTNQR